MSRRRLQCSHKSKAKNEDIGNGALIDRPAFKSTLQQNKQRTTNDGIEASAMEERQQLARERGIDEDGLSAVLLHLAEIALAQPREIRVAILDERAVRVGQHAAEMIHVLHRDHIAAVHHEHLDRRQVIPALTRLDLLQRQRGRDDQIAVVEVRVQTERAPAE